ncbi:MAG: hypothetical protein OEM91_13035 [Hyphomicrobiales bacterium]|nr:hypothetical protein [Hyphomicrobiales bacterium]
MANNPYHGEAAAEYQVRQLASSTVTLLDDAILRVHPNSFDSQTAHRMFVQGELANLNNWFGRSGSERLEPISITELLAGLAWLVKGDLYAYSISLIFKRDPVPSNVAMKAALHLIATQNLPGAHVRRSEISAKLEALLDLINNVAEPEPGDPECT